MAQNQEQKNGYIVVPKSQYLMYQSDAKISAYGALISIELIKDLLNNPKYYHYVESLFDGIFACLNVYYRVDNELYGSISLSRTDIAECLKYLKEHNMLPLDEDFKTKADIFINKVSFARFLQEYQNANMDITIDNIPYSIPYNSLITFLQFSDKEYQELCSNDEIKEINGIPKSHFIYAVSKLNLSDNYNMPEIIIKRLENLKRYIDYDFEAVNKVFVTKGEQIKNAEVNPLLKAALKKDLPESYSALESAIYIYFKMCEILSYDEEYFATNETGNTAKRHSDINNISTITPKNNLVVCYEFNAIYAKMLEELGINYEIISSVMETYGKGHAYLEFRAGKFLIKADAVSPFFKSDIYYVKVDKLPNGLQCLNESENTQQEFFEIINKVYADFRARNPEKTSLNDIASMYNSLNDKEIPTPSIQERIDMFYEKIRSSNLIGIDRLSYILNLYRIMFSLNEKRDNFIVSVVRNKRPEDKTKEASPEVIITLNEEGFYKNFDDNKYFILKSDNNVIPVTREYLLSKFYSETFNYTEATDHHVPGI